MMPRAFSAAVARVRSFAGGPLCPASGRLLWERSRDGRHGRARDCIEGGRVIGRIASLALVYTLVLGTTMPVAAADRLFDSPSGTADAAGRQAAIEAMAMAWSIDWAEAERRVILTEALEPLMAFVNGDVDRFAEAYRTSLGSEWKTVINHVVPLAEARALTAPLIPKGAAVAYHHVSHSSRELEDALRAIAPDLLRSGARGVEIDVANNGIRLLLHPARQDEPRQVALRIVSVPVSFEMVDENYYGPVSARSAAPDAALTLGSHGSGCTSRSDCPTWRGGVQIIKSDGLGKSTIGLWAKSGSQRFVLMAGHGDLNGSWQHDAFTIGSHHLNSLWHNLSGCPSNCWTSADVARIANSHGSPNNWVYKDAGLKTLNMTSLNPGSVGDTACKSGMGKDSNNDYYQCGIISTTTGITSIERLPGSAVIDLYNMMRADFNRSLPGSGLVGGDSGASIFYGNTFRGMAATGEGYYSKPYHIQDLLGVAICITPNCQ